MRSSGHKQIDHTADLALELWAESEVALLAEAAHAVVDIMTESTPLVASESVTIEIDAIDREDRLVQWVNEIIYLAVTTGFLVAKSSIELHTEFRLTAVLTGQPRAADKIAGELKSATYHDLVFEERDGAREGSRSSSETTSKETYFWARLVIDV